IFLQTVRGLDAFHTGLSLLPLSVSLLIVAPLSAMLVKKIYPKMLIMIGLFLSIISSLVLYLTIKPDATALKLAPGLALFGIGFGMIASQITNITMSSVD